MHLDSSVTPHQAVCSLWGDRHLPFVPFWAGFPLLQPAGSHTPGFLNSSCPCVVSSDHICGSAPKSQQFMINPRPGDAKAGVMPHGLRTFLPLSPGLLWGWMGSHLGLYRTPDVLPLSHRTRCPGGLHLQCFPPSLSPLSLPFVPHPSPALPLPFGSFGAVWALWSIPTHGGLLTLSAEGPDELGQCWHSQTRVKTLVGLSRPGWVPCKSQTCPLCPLQDLAQHQAQGLPCHSHPWPFPAGFGG